MKRAFLLLATMLASPVAAQTVAITNATIAVGDGSAPVENGTVVFQNGRIVAAGSGVAVPAGAQVIDGIGNRQACLTPLRAGMVVVNVNPLYTPRELEHQLKDSGAEAIVILENFAVTLQEVIDRTPMRRIGEPEEVAVAVKVIGLPCVKEAPLRGLLKATEGPCVGT